MKKLSSLLLSASLSLGIMTPGISLLKPILISAEEASTEPDFSDYETSTYNAATGPTYQWYSDGEEQGNFELKTVNDLVGFANVVNDTVEPANNQDNKFDEPNSFKGKTVTLAENTIFNLSGIPSWEPIGHTYIDGDSEKYTIFEGTFNGNDSVIQDLNIDNTQTYTDSKNKVVGRSSWGFFGHASATIQNLIIDNVTIDVIGPSVGALSGDPFTSTISDITVMGDVNISGSHYVGGILGHHYYGNGTNLNVAANEGSFVKSTAADYDNSEDNGTDASYVGGIIGHTGEGTHTLSNSSSNIDVYGNIRGIGGIIGFANGDKSGTYTVKDVTCTGDVYINEKAESYTDGDKANPDCLYRVGGIVGTWLNTNGSLVLNNCTYTTGQVGIFTEGEDGEITIKSARELPYDFDTTTKVGYPRSEPNATSATGKIYIQAEGEDTPTQLLALSGNTYYETVADAFNDVTSKTAEGSFDLLADTGTSGDDETSNNSVELTLPVTVYSKGYDNTGIAWDEDENPYGFEYKDPAGEETEEEEPSQETKTWDIVPTAEVHDPTVSIAPASARIQVSETQTLTASLTAGDTPSIPIENNKGFYWESSNPDVAIVTANENSTTAVVTGVSEGSATITAVPTYEFVKDGNEGLTPGSATINVYVPSYSPGPGGTVSPSPTPPETETPDTPDDTPEEDTPETNPDFDPDSGVNSGVTGEGPGFTENGSQSITYPETNTTVTYNQNTDGSKTATTQDAEGNVTSAVVTVPESALQNNQANVSLGTNESGQTLAIPGNKVVEGTAPHITINLPENTTEAKVSVPIESGTLDPGTVAMLVGEDGSLTPIILTTTDSDSSSITIPLTGSQRVVIMDNSLTFQDSSTMPDYAQNAAAFTSARRLMTGMGESSPKPFDFAANTSRGQFATILYRLEGEPAVSGNVPEGIIEGAWNANAATWAVDNGLMAQGGSRFNPQDDITRDQIIAIVYRMNGSQSADLSVLDKYSDADLIPNTEFRNAMAWGVQHGIIGQGVDTLNPESDANRAEIAAMIQRIIENLY